MWARLGEWERAAADLFPTGELSSELRLLTPPNGSASRKKCCENSCGSAPRSRSYMSFGAGAAREGRARAGAGALGTRRTLYERDSAAHPEDPHLAGQLAEVILEANQPIWHTLKVHHLKSAAGATLSVQPDGSVLASGTDAPGDTYTITAACDLPRVAALRLEVLPDPSLPNGGPGRHPSGNFQLAAIRLRLSSDGGEAGEWLPFRDAWASYSWPAEVVDVLGTIRPDLSKVWHVWGRFGKRHTALFLPKTPAVVQPNQRLVIELEHFRELPVNLGRFRLSVSDDEQALQKERERQRVHPAARHLHPVPSRPAPASGPASAGRWGRRRIHHRGANAPRSPGATTVGLTPPRPPTPRTTRPVPARTAQSGCAAGRGLASLPRRTSRMPHFVHHHGQQIDTVRCPLSVVFRGCR